MNRDLHCRKRQNIAGSLMWCYIEGQFLYQIHKVVSYLEKETIIRMNSNQLSTAGNINGYMNNSSFTRYTDKNH